MVLLIETLIFTGAISLAIAMHKIFRGCKTEDSQRIVVQQPSPVRRRRRKRRNSNEPLITKIQRGEQKIFDSNEVTECVICLDYLDKGDDIRVLKCGHVFHDGCIEEWFMKEVTCPICRDEN